MDNLIKNYHKLSEEKQKLVKVLLKEQGIDLSSMVIMPEKRDKEVYPLSFAQQRLWFLEKLEPNSPLYIIPMGMKIKGNINLDFLIEAIQTVANRHEILRTRFIEKNGVGYQQVLDELEISPNLIELGSDSDIENEINKIMRREFTTPFKLDECPLFRVTLIKIKSDYNILLLPMHHIISDNWSMGILLDEILKIYESKMNGSIHNLPDLAIQYVDYSVWQKEWLNGDNAQKQLNYWKEQLDNSNTVLDIVPDKPKPSVQSYNGASVYFNLDESITHKIELFCKQNNITPFTLFLSVYQLILAKYARQSDINIGVPVANRNRVEVETLIGFFINTLVLRTKIDFSKTVIEYLTNNSKLSKEAFENQDIPFEMIVDKLDLERDVANTALFQAMLVLNNAQIRELKFNDLEFTPIDYDTKTTKFNLILSLTKQGESYNCKFEYNTDLFYESTINEYIKQFKWVLNLFIDKPHNKLKDIFKLQSVQFIDQQKNITVKENSIREIKFVHQAFTEISKKNPEKIAISNGIEHLTYKQLDSYSNCLAKKLCDSGIKPETSVGVYLNRKIEYVVAILAIFKSGGTFVPLDINAPKDRLDLVIENAGIQAIITDSTNKTNVSENIEIINIDLLNPNDDSDVVFVSNNYSNAAYVIYTSGSTGLPKGVVVQHDKFYYHIRSIISSFGIKQNDKYMAFAAFNFDPSLEQIFVPLLAGASVYLRGDEYWMPSTFLDIIKEKKITVINPPTIYWNQFVQFLFDNKVKDVGELRLVISGGEEMKPDLLNKWLNIVDNNVELINAYGPTETVITSAMHTISNEDKSHYHIPIGKVIGNRIGYVVDSEMNLLGPNSQGELCIGGNVIARCYKDNPSLTADKFIPDPFSNGEGMRIYRTGDLVMYDSNGYIKYLGRIDNQIKIRGFRIELGEIETVIADKLSTQVIANAVKDVNGIYKIVAYVVSNDSSQINEKDLMDYCGTKLPKYMVPSRIITIDKVPLNINGKLDKQKLPKPNLNVFERNVEYVEPRSELEKEIAQILGKILNIEKVGVFDNFFELGGHSILAIKVVSQIKEKYGVDIDLVNLFQNPTVDGLAEAVVEAQSNLIDDNDLESLLDELESIE